MCRLGPARRPEPGAVEMCIATSKLIRAVCARVATASAPRGSLGRRRTSDSAVEGKKGV
jgi:hypothetical protein